MSTDKTPRMFYYEGAEDAWSPVPDRIDEILDVDVFGFDGQMIEIVFKRMDMTDDEFNNLPEG